MEYAALATWLLTAVFGFVMLATWVSHGGARAAAGPGGGRTSNFRSPVVFGHFLLAVAGLVVWLVYLVADSIALAWVAFADLVVVAVLGETLILRWTKDRRSATGTVDGTGDGTGAGAGATAATGSAAAATGGGASGDTLTGHAATGTSTGRLAEQRFPVPVVGAHGLFAVATLVLVLLTALGVGGS
jgi:hypothetical protein